MGGSTGAAEFVGCQSGFTSTSGSIVGAVRACVRILGGCETILVLATAPACTALMGLATSPSDTAVLVCERPGCTRPLVPTSSPKVRAALVLALCCI
ncbi:unnamed protein product [Staurois parvus]|uniref:Uncharacterized protein n=1 Tax=Staurois parvus TaxID=386267 RepID=A0ABN9AGF1_9NEOB|nr:unnamed protein product [Staurois parvus]CAI9602399.1 unnamed protein product [Staurois parvus]